MDREAKLIGRFALGLGCAAGLTGASILLGVSNPPEGLSCKAICGLVLIITALFGDFAGTLAGGLLWLTVSVAFCFVGYRVLNKQSHP
jgi:hypothetical protein